MKKVAIISTGHPPFDERIFNKIGKSLTKFSFEVTIIVTTADIEKDISSIKFKGIDLNKKNRFIEKFKFIIKELKKLNPDLIINCEPLPVLFSYFFILIQKKSKPAKIIYDVTEWYPENIYLKKKGLKKTFLFFFGHFINFLATNFSDYLFIGEETKLDRYRKYSPRKKFSIISYYPVLEYYKPSMKKIENNEIIFGYAGVISISRGLKIFYDLIDRLISKFSNYNFGFMLVGRFENEDEEFYLQKFGQLKIKFQYFRWTNYEDFSKYLEPVHICLDIRPPNKIYERSLPIKIFDYMALGKCIVASNYEPIKNIFELANCGILVNPLYLDEIVNQIGELIQKPELIYQFGVNGRHAAERFFNWSICEAELERAINSLLN
ncbi:MAG: glycosyltransferase [Ignavibacteria bacterium]|jgi:glycosyltransferase involved in cell wall biosynthesis|nr:glycosyltransferase [Ignavibacteria bacterium]MDH7527357.1 glycosyltransferase [Ignavibacteria bacterium]